MTTTLTNGAYHSDNSTKTVFWVWIFEEANEDSALGEMYYEEDNETKTNGIQITWSADKGQYRAFVPESGTSMGDIYISLYDDKFVGSFDNPVAAMLGDTSIHGVKRQDAVDITEDCPLENTLGNDSESLETLRNFRDQVLSRTEQGRAFTRLYYLAAPFITAALQADPALQLQLKKALHRCIELIKRQ